MVRAQVVRDHFPGVVRALGGQPDGLLAQAGIAPEALACPGGVIRYRSMIDLFEASAAHLRCPDFGLRMARQTGAGVSLLGPLEVAMRNSHTLGAAYDYCSRHIHIYSPAVHISVEHDDYGGRDYLHFDIVLDGVPRVQQAVEHAMALTYNTARTLSDNQARPSEIWLSHGPLACVDNYRQFFGVPLRFGMPYNAMFFSTGDLTQPVRRRDEQIYASVLNYIQRECPPPRALAKQLRCMLVRMLASGGGTQAAIADALALHPRTFQRRLQEEGTTFEAVVDNVRREVALRSLADERISLGQITERLGYSEASVLTRSCHRWFSCSPRELRRAAVRH